MSRQVWGQSVRQATYAGHDGLLYDHSPSTFEELFEGTTVWTDRTFLVHGERRISFAEFRAAAHAARAHIEGL
ncbi:MAG: AMP-dependent synthetase [Pseudonocardiales bacterium]|nr:AMP-dependent synthetase [Pseudonocardiales bacterium]